MCDWFALCENEPTAVRQHPILGSIEICDRCANRVDDPVAPVERERLRARRTPVDLSDYGRY